MNLQSRVDLYNHNSNGVCDKFMSREKLMHSQNTMNYYWDFKKSDNLLKYIPSLALLIFFRAKIFKF